MRALCLLLLASPAFAHINLEEPANFQLVDNYGNPQKTEPCGGAGTPSNVVTTVVAGSQLRVQWRETIYHPGHFRLGIAPDPSQFVTPTPVLNMGGNNCASAPIDRNPALPVILDGIPHPSVPDSRITATITVPMMSCENCTLQLMQFMSAHAPPCFYFQCARLRIVMPDAGMPVVDAGVEDAGVEDAGVKDAGVEDAGIVDAGTADAGSEDAGTMEESDGGVHEHPPVMGCGCSSGAEVGGLGLVALLWRRRGSAARTVG